MPKIIVLHDYDNPANEVPIDSAAITNVVAQATGKGSIVSCGNNSGSATQIHVIESPEQVEQMRGQ